MLARGSLASLLVAAAVLATCTSARPQAAPAPPLLGINVNSGYLAAVDPLTLRELPGPRLDLRGSGLGWSFSPDRTRLVLGDTHGHVDLVDTQAVTLLGELRTSSDAPLAASAWIGSRVLAAWRSPGGVRLRVIDPDTRRALRTRVIRGSLQAVARTPRALLLLLGPARGIGPSALAVVDGAGGVRRIGLARIASGQTVPRARRLEVIRHASPGLAVDGTGGRALVVAAGAPVADVDLATLSVSYHSLSEPLARQAKGAPSGPDRHVLWLGDGLLAVFGSDDQGWIDAAGHPQLRVNPAGLRLVDTRTWTATTLDPGATQVTEADGALLATASLWDSVARRSRGIGLVAYGTDAARRFHLFGQETVYVQAVGGRAFVRPDGPEHGYSIVDLASGRVVDEVRGTEPPFVLGGDASSWIS